MNNPPISGQGKIPPNFCQFRGINVMCGPRGLPGEPDHLFHNNGDGTFTDVSVKAGVADKQGLFGLSSVFVDVDDDGWLDLAGGQRFHHRTISIATNTTERLRTSATHRALP